MTKPKVDMSWMEVMQRVGTVRLRCESALHKQRPLRYYGVPRGGAVVAGLTGNPVDSPNEADVIVDDIVDSGRTRDRWESLYPGKPFHALVDKSASTLDAKLGWVSFPWEHADQDADAEDSVVRLLQHLGEDPARPGLVDTPRRVVKAWRELTAGYSQDPKAVLGRTFPSDGYDEMVVSRAIDFHSTCEHHMLPFFGQAHVGYIPGPDRTIVGLSKLARVVDVFARRLQVQERLTRQVADAIQSALAPVGVGVVVEAQHMCMACRGVRKANSSMVTSCLLGAFRAPETRAEFMRLIGGVK